MNDEKVQELYKTLIGHEISYWEFIGEVTKKIKPKRILEIGSGWGMSSTSFMYHSDATMISIDKNPIESLPLFNQRIELFDYWNRVQFIWGESKVVVPSIDESFDLIYIDGDHTYNGCKEDIELCWKKVFVGGYLLFDDVLHYLNWTSRNPKEITEFGVTRAICEFAKERGFNFEVIARANGFGLIQIINENKRV